MDPTFAAIALLLCVSGLLSLWARRRPLHSSSLPLPPGPRQLPIIGNLFDMPTKDMARSFRDMCNQYGDVIYLNMWGQPTVVISSYDAAMTILEAHSVNTSDRPPLLMAELVGIMWQFALQGYWISWRHLRRTFHGFFHQGAMIRYQHIQRDKNRQFLNRLLETPEKFQILSRGVIGATIMDAVYGIEINEETEYHVAIAERGADVFSEITSPGRFLIELFPSLRHVPAWLPGAKFKRLAAVWKEEIAAVKNTGYEAVVQSMAKGVARPSIVSDMVNDAMQNDGNVPAEAEERIKSVSAIAYVAGADTTYASLMAFFLAMAQHPEVQCKAQRELDEVVGPDRLVDFADRDSLPYVNAVIKEISRWHIVFPLGIPHRAIDDDEYDGYLIPAGSTLVANHWAISRDPVAYPDPEAFIPERFMKDGKLNHLVRDPAKFQFGFGRRICPGRHFSDEVLFLNVASILQNFDVRSPLDADGKPLPVRAEIPMNKTLSHPENFRCEISPRSLATEARVRQSLHG